MTVPDELHYTREHEWVAIDGSTATVGITDHAQHALGDVVYVSAPAQGSKVTAGEPCGEVESTKSVSDIFAPVDGEVTRGQRGAWGEPWPGQRRPVRGWLAVQGHPPRRRWRAAARPDDRRRVRRAHRRRGMSVAGTTGRPAAVRRGDRAPRAAVRRGRPGGHARQRRGDAAARRGQADPAGEQVRAVPRADRPGAADGRLPRHPGLHPARGAVAGRAGRERPDSRRLPDGGPHRPGPAGRRSGGSRLDHRHGGLPRAPRHDREGGRERGRAAPGPGVHRHRRQLRGAERAAAGRRAPLPDPDPRRGRRPCRGHRRPARAAPGRPHGLRGADRRRRRPPGRPPALRPGRPLHAAAGPAPSLPGAGPRSSLPSGTSRRWSS